VSAIADRVADLKPRVAELGSGLRLPYVQRGDPAATPLILLHGLTDSWRTYELVLGALSDDVPAIALTQRGHGDASRPAHGYRASDFASDLLRFLDALGVQRAVLVAHSSHTFVAERCAIECPERVAGLVLIGAPATLRGKPGVARLLEEVARLIDPIPADFVRDFTQAAYHRPLPPAFLEAMRRESLEVPAHVWREAFPGLLEDDQLAELHHIAAPTLLIWGDRDAIVSEQDQRALLAAIPSARLEIYRGTGHTPHWEVPARLAADLEAFARAHRG
jgi:pimeloyl-ACP methyl ester carboxylesterase